MKKRWISLLLVLALVLAVWSVCAVAADAQKADAAVGETAAAEPAAEELTEEEPTEEEAPAEESPAAAEDTEAADAEAPAEDGEQNHIHAVNREDGCEEPSFVPLTVTGGKLESGCYYLTDDLALEEPLCVPKNGAQVTLCLNGHTLSLADGVEGCIIFLAVSDEDAEPSVLTITDCNGADSSSNYYIDETGALVFDDGSYAWQEAYIAASEKNALAGGRITGATAGAISVGDYNELYLTSVNIIDNAGRYGAGVVVAEHASAVLDSCVIAGNRLTGEMKTSEKQILGGGVYCAGTLELSGTTSITGNRAQDAQNNLWLDENAEVKIGNLGLDKQAKIGVSGAAEQTILTGYADDFSDNFTSDDLTLTVSAVRENGFTDLTLQEAVYTLTLELGEDSEPVTLEAEQGKSLRELNVEAPERENMQFDGWHTEDGGQVDAEEPLHLTGDTTLFARWTQDEPQSGEAALLTYDPDAPITKQEAAKTLYQMARQLGLDTEAGQDVDLTQFEDADEISEDAADAVRWAYAADLLMEKDGKLHVADELTRKELTRMLEDFLDQQAKQFGITWINGWEKNLNSLSRLLF